MMLSADAMILTHHRNYAVAVHRPDIRERLRGRIGNIRIRRSEYDNIAADVSDYLKDIDIMYDKITIDTAAEVEIFEQPKLLKEVHKPVSAQELLLYPFRYYLGIIVPYMIVGDTGSSVVMQAYVIDPVEDYGLFVRSLGRAR